MNFIEQIIMNMDSYEPVHKFRSDDGLFEAEYLVGYGIDGSPCTLVTVPSNATTKPVLRVKAQVGNLSSTVCSILHETLRNSYKCMIYVSSTVKKETAYCNYIRHKVPMQSFRSEHESTTRINDIYSEEEMFQLSTMYDLPHDIMVGMDKAQDELLKLPFTGSYMVSGKWDVIDYLRSN